jgi:hypothetical protein
MQYRHTGTATSPEYELHRRHRLQLVETRLADACLICWCFIGIFLGNGAVVSQHCSSRANDVLGFRMDAVSLFSIRSIGIQRTTHLSCSQQ